MWLLPAFPTSPELKLFDLSSFKFGVILSIKYSVLFCQRWGSEILNDMETTYHPTHSTVNPEMNVLQNS